MTELLSQPAVKKLPPEVQRWLGDIHQKSSIVARLSAEIEGCIHYVDEQIRARQDLIKALAHIRVPALSVEMKKSLLQESERALRQLAMASKKAHQAKMVFGPCRDYFLNKKSPTLRRDRDSLLTLLVQYGGVTRNRASGLVKDLLPTINPNFTWKQSSIRVSAYPPSTSST